jgi:hypothetical protein
MACSDHQEPFEPLPHTSLGILSGTVRAEGQAVADATVRLEPMVDGLPISIRSQLDPTKYLTRSAKLNSTQITLTDESGSFRFNELVAGDYLVRTNARNHLSGLNEVGIPEYFAAAETTFVDIDLVPTGTFTGNVTLQNETNHSGSLVYVLGSSNVAVTDSSGNYAITDVPVGTHSVQAGHPGWLDESTAGSIVAAGDLVPLSNLFLLRENNISPTAVIDPLPAVPVQNVLEAVQLFPTGSVDPDGSIVLFEWDYEDDGVFDASAISIDAASIAIPISTPGSYRTKLRVTDDKGAIGLAVISYTVYDAFYVSSFLADASGSDGTGTKADPFATIQFGIDAAAAQGRPVVVDNLASYSEAPDFQSNVDVLGGHDASWNPTSTPSLVLIDSYSSATATGVSSAEIRGLRLEHDHAQGDAQTAIGMILSACSSSLRFVDCEIVVGNGTAAFSTAPGGAAGSNGSAGDNGYGINCNLGQFCFGDDAGCSYYLPGAGGNGVAQGWDGGRGGMLCPASLENGAPGSGPGGGSGGAGVTASCIAAGNGQPGDPGTDGTDGAHGAMPTASFGTIIGQSWFGPTGLPGASGANDATGGSGGGGGGSLAVDDFGCFEAGGAGGGGGGAGSAGTGGLGGPGGGASIAVLVLGGSPSFENCLIQTGNGGNGWRGGAGGIGGNGGASGNGGAGFGLAGNGGAGGVGGDGASGGGGSGGPGGPSVGIYEFASASVNLTGISWVIGNGGSGGPGGLHGDTLSQAASGPSGLTAQVYTHP